MPSAIDPELRKRKRRDRFSSRNPMAAKFDGWCIACGNAIEEGEPIVGVYDKFKRKTTYLHAGECVEEWIG